MTRPHEDLDICYSQFNGAEVDLVPVVRIFGPTPAGQKVCLHLHKVCQKNETKPKKKKKKKNGKIKEKTEIKEKRKNKRKNVKKKEKKEI
jgi:hypothetical protein